MSGRCAHSGFEKGFYLALLYFLLCILSYASSFKYWIHEKTSLKLILKVVDSSPDSLIKKH
jgi:hypothetical protein